MKKVLIAAKDMNIGGVEKSLLSLLDTLSPAEYQVDLLLLESYGGFLDAIPEWINVSMCTEYDSLKDEVNLPPLSVIRGHIKTGRFLRALRLGLGYCRYKLTGNFAYYYKSVFKGIPMHPGYYDAAISYSSIISYLTWYVCNHVNATKKVGWIHFDISKLAIDHKMMNDLHRKMEKIYVVSREAMNAFVREFPDLREKCELRYNVVDKNTIIRRAQAPAENLKKPESCLIMTLGRLSAEKGQDIIPDVAARLKAKGLKFKWCLIGDGNLRPAIEKRIEELGLMDYVILLGTKANPYPYLKQADVYVQTSVHEGYCISLAEARSFDLPIVSTSFAGAYEQLEGRKKSVIALRDASVLADEIETIVENTMMC